MDLTHLGKQSEIPTEPSDTILDPIPNPHPGIEYVVRFTCPEMTSTCPATKQPDFATIVIDYIPDHFLVESKSLKLYLFSYRNHGAFHEDCTVRIGLHIRNRISPTYIRVGGFWMPRGGISIDTFYEWGNSGIVKIPSFPSTYRERW